MSKIFNVYNEERGLDKAWFESSNVKYAECDDKEGELKTVRVVFNNGSQYQYNNVNVYDYLKFREDNSQGKAFNKYLRKYEFEKLDFADLKKIDDELAEAIGGPSWSVVYKENEVLVLDDNEQLVCGITCNITEDLKKVLQHILPNIDKAKKWEFKDFKEE